MRQGVRPAAEAAPPDEDAPVRDRPRCGWWVPRLPTIFAAVLVGYSLFVMVFLDQNVGKPPAARYGWPFTYRVVQHYGLHPPLRLGTGALAADLVIAAALLASSCFTTQVAACLLMRSTCIKLRSACCVVAALALCFAACKFRPIVLVLALYVGYYYSLASPILPILMMLMRLELPKCDRPEQTS
jgi:hypothetical protein